MNGEVVLRGHSPQTRAAMGLWALPTEGVLWQKGPQSRPDEPGKKVKKKGLSLLASVRGVG